MTSFSLSHSLTYMKLKLWLKVGVFSFLSFSPPRFFIGVYVSIFDFNLIYLFIFKIFQTLLFLSIHHFV